MDKKSVKVPKRKIETTNIAEKVTNEMFALMKSPIQDEVVEASTTTSTNSSGEKKEEPPEVRKMMKIKSYESSTLSELSLNSSSNSRHHENIEIQNIEVIRSDNNCKQMKRMSLKKRLLFWKKTKANKHIFSSDKSTATPTTNASFDDGTLHVLVCSCDVQDHQHQYGRHEETDLEGLEFVQTINTSISDRGDTLNFVDEKNVKDAVLGSLSSGGLAEGVHVLDDEIDGTLIIDGEEADSTIVAIVDPQQLYDHHQQQTLHKDDEERQKLINFFDTYFEPFNGETMCGAVGGGVGGDGGGCFCDGANGPDDYFATVNDMIDNETILKMTVCTACDRLPLHTRSISSISSLGSIKSISDNGEDDDHTMDLLNYISETTRRRRNQIKSSATVLHSKDKDNKDLVFIISTNENYGIHEELVSIDLVLL